MQKHNEWLCAAEQDFASAKKLMIGDDTPSTAIYHTQQVAEKSLKAFIIFKGLECPFEHDLGKLLKSCVKQDPSFIQLKKAAEELSPYYIKSRYPDDCLYVPTKTEIIRAIKLAKQVLNFVKSKVI